MTDSADRVPVDRMRQLVRDGQAQPMLAEFDVGPTFYADRWWHIPNDAPADADYVPAGPELATSFDRTRSRLDRIDAFLARAE